MANDINITNGSLLGFSYNIVDFGSDFRFGVRKVITVQVSELECGGKTTEGKIGKQAKVLDDLASTEDYINLTINGHKFTDKYQLSSFSLEEGNWQVVTQGTLTFEAYTKGSVSFEAGDNDYAGWGEILEYPDWRLMEDFSDDFEFQRSANSISYSHNVLIKFSAQKNGGNQGITPPLAAGLAIAKNLVDEMASRPDFNWLVETELQGLYSEMGPPHKRFITESVDEINSVVKVSEKFDAENIKSGTGSDYSFSATQTVELLETGIVNVSEKGKVIGLLGDKHRIIDEAALTREIGEAAKIGGRLEEVFNAHKVMWGEIYDCEEDIPDLVLNEEKSEVLLIEKGILRDSFRGVGSYEIKATNDQKISDKAIHEFVTTIEGIEYDSDAKPKSYLKASQRGTFTGASSDNKIPKGKTEDRDRPRFGEALTEWIDQKEDIKNVLRGCVGNNKVYSAALSNTYSPFKGTVAYGMEYSNEPKYGTVDTEYKQWTRQYNDAKTAHGERCVFQNTVQNVVNHPESVQLVQKRNTTQLPNANASHRLVGKRDTTLKKLTKEMLDADPDIQLKSLGPDGNNSKANPKKLKSADYTFNNDNDKILNVSFGWE